MTWRDRLLPASYGGVPFVVDSHEFSGGRRLAVHEYPLRDRPYVEDMGRGVRRFRVSGWVVGDDYQEKRDRLRKKLEQRGPGWPYRPGRTLVHPYFGRLEVAVESWRIRESTDEGRMARFEMVFVEAGTDRFPTFTASLSSGVDTQAAATLAAAGADIEENLAVSGPEDLRLAVSTKLREFSTALAGATSAFTGAAADTAALANDLTNLIEDGSSLATAPADLVAAIVSTVGNVLSAASSARGALAAYEGLFGFASGTTGGTSTLAASIDANRERMARFFRLAAITGATRAAARVSWEYLEEAEAARDRILAELDAISGQLDDTTYGRASLLAGKLTGSVPPPDEDLPRIRTVVLPRPTPSLVLAWRLYADRSRALEIVARNSLRNPATVPAGPPIEVLSGA